MRELEERGHDGEVGAEGPSEVELKWRRSIDRLLRRVRVVGSARGARGAS